MTEISIFRNASTSSHHEWSLQRSDGGKMENYIKEGLKWWKLDSVMDTVNRYAIIGFVMTRPFKDEDKTLPSSTKFSLKKIRA